MQLLTIEDVLSRINEYFKDDFLTRTKPIIQPNETYLWAGNYSYGEHEEYGLLESLLGGGSDYWKKITIGYCIITSYRLIFISFKVDENRSKNRLFKTGYFHTVVYNFDPLNSPLKNAELKTRDATEIDIRDLSGIDRQEYEYEIDGNKQKLVKIQMNDVSPIFFPSQEGKEIYDLIFEIKNNPPIFSNQSEKPGTLDLLRNLELLHKHQVLSDEIYETAKTKLLGIE